MKTAYKHLFLLILSISSMQLISMDSTDMMQIETQQNVDNDIRQLFNDLSVPEHLVQKYFLFADSNDFEKECFAYEILCQYLVKAFVTKKIDIEFYVQKYTLENNIENTSLHYAVLNDDKIAIFALLAFDLSLLDKQNICGLCPIALAAHDGKFSLIQFFMALKNTWNQLFMQSLQHKQSSMAELAFNRGIDIRYIQMRTKEPILLTMYKNYMVGMSKIDGIAKSLICIGCQIDKVKNNEAGYLALRNLAALELINLVKNNDTDNALKLIEQQPLLTRQDRDGNTALHHAVLKNNNLLVAILLQYNKVIENSKNDDGKTPKQLALESTDKQIINLF